MLAVNLSFNVKRKDKSIFLNLVLEAFFNTLEKSSVEQNRHRLNKAQK